jgi:hypothetical protein
MYCIPFRWGMGVYSRRDSERDGTHRALETPLGVGELPKCCPNE